MNPLRACALLLALISALADSNLVQPLRAAGRQFPFFRSGPRTHKVTLRTEDGVALAAMWYEPSRRPAPAVILVHMLTKSRREWDDVAERLATDGIGALAIDLRGHGESSGDGGDPAAMVRDVKAAQRHLAVRPDVVHSRIGILGASIGANLAVLAAADDPQVVSLALLSPSLEYRGLRIEAALRKYGKNPVLLVAGDNDAYAMRSAKELQKAGGGPREVVILSGAGHGTTMLGRAPELLPQLIGWFGRTLQ